MLTKPVVLIGPMGVGKTTIGKKLAKRLELPFIDTDQLIIAEHGAIPEIFAKQGEVAFREIEAQVVLQALGQQAVIATGGGAVLNGDTQRNLKSAYVIYLATDGKHMKSRLSHTKRPLLANGMEDWVRIYAERKPLYESLADFEIDTSNISLSETIRVLCAKIEEL
jgi:shikimate kinase